MAPEIEFFLYHQVTDSIKKVEKNAGKETAEEGVSRRSVKERVRILKLVLIQWIVFDLLFRLYPSPDLLGDSCQKSQRE